MTYIAAELSKNGVWVGPMEMTWSNHQCQNAHLVYSRYGVDLKTCKDLCKKSGKCNAINYTPNKGQGGCEGWKCDVEKHIHAPQNNKNSLAKGYCLSTPPSVYTPQEGIDFLLFWYEIINMSTSSFK